MIPVTGSNPICAHLVGRLLPPPPLPPPLVVTGRGAVGLMLTTVLLVSPPPLASAGETAARLSAATPATSVVWRSRMIGVPSYGVAGAGGLWLAPAPVPTLTFD